MSSIGKLAKLGGQLGCPFISAIDARRERIVASLAHSAPWQVSEVESQENEILRFG